MKTYTIWVGFYGTARYEIEADSKEEACDIAIDRADVSDCYSLDYELCDCECNED